MLTGGCLLLEQLIGLSVGPFQPLITPTIPLEPASCGQPDLLGLLDRTMIPEIPVHPRILVHHAQS